jgi:hypothetical protein
MGCDIRGGVVNGIHRSPSLELEFEVLRLGLPSTFLGSFLVGFLESTSFSPN